MHYNHPEPTKDQRAALAAVATRITGHQIRLTQSAWIREVLLVHGPDAEAALERGYREGGWDNLFLRVVDSPNSSATERAAGVPAQPAAADEPPWDTDAEVGQIEVAQEPITDASAMFPDDTPEFDLPEYPSRSPRSDDLWGCYPGLLYGPNDRPPFDPTSTTRWDDRASNPDRDALRARHEAAVPRVER